MDARSPHMTVFEVDPIQGVLKQDGSRPHYSDKAEVSPYWKSFNDSNISAEAMSTHFPFCSFGLKLHIFYSKSFKRVISKTFDPDPVGFNDSDLQPIETWKLTQKPDELLIMAVPLPNKDFVLLQSSIILLTNLK